MSDIKDEIDSVDVAVESNDLSKLFKFTFSVERYRNLPQKVLPSLPTFTPCKIKGQHLSKIFGTVSSSSPTSDKYGYSMKTTKNSPEAGSSPPVKQLLDEPQMVTTIDTGYERLFNVACLSDEEIWTSGLDRTMKLFSINQGSLLKSITTKSGYSPFDIVTKSGDLVYTDYYNSTLNIVKNEKIEELISLQNWHPQCVCSTSSGDFLKQTFCPQGITTDSQSHILIADIDNDCVHIIDQDGQFLRYIYCELSGPKGLCIDTNDNLFVAQWRNRQVKKIKYLSEI
ncbi:uncharacterized protein LOC134247778 [Saccostrea cucullata]|uniref:uncharacterized protein LOC134247778 n=1 Tax=Saccostrea cuccullata TaxID=36930 RepID=UPI002ED69230